MAEILLFHHAQGQTPGFLAFADDLRAAGHVVHAPDLYDGNTFDDLDEGVGYAKQVGFGEILERGRLAAEGLPERARLCRFLARRHARAAAGPDARGLQGSAAVLGGAACLRVRDGAWPPGVPVQIHMMEDDEWAEEDLPAARELVEANDGAELFLYPGDGHLFADSSLAGLRRERRDAAEAARPRIPGQRRVDADRAGQPARWALRYGV